MAANVLLVVDNYAPRIGGAELVYQRLAEGLAVRGHQVVVITTGCAGVAASERLNGVEVHRLGANRYLFAVSALFFMLKLKVNFDVVQTATYSAAIPAWFYARLKRKPVLIIVHEVLGKIWFKGFNRAAATMHWLLERLVLLFPYTRYVAVSEYTKQTLLEVSIPAAKIVVIRNGLDVIAPPVLKPRAAGRPAGPANPFTFLYFGRLGVSKGVDVLVGALEMLLPQRVDFNFLFIIGAAEHGVLLRQITDLQTKYAQRITILRALPRDELLHLNQSVSCVVVPSYSEGFGLSALETCALGTPLIASDGGALWDNLWGKVNYFHSGDAMGLVKAMERALLGDFDVIPDKPLPLWQTMIAAYGQLYESLS